MKGITERVVEEIKARTDLAELIASYGVNVRHAGSSLKACCPFHNEKTPSFNINVSRGFYHCFGCGETGDAIKFVQKMEGLTFVEAVKKLADACGMKIEEKEDPEAGLRRRLYALMAELADFYHRCLLKTKEAEPARDYLAKRSLDGECADDWTIGYAPNGISTILKWAEKHGYTFEELVAAGVVKPPDRPGDAGFHRFGGRLMFTVRDKQGRVVAFSGRQLVERKNSGKYVNSPETPIFKKSRVLFAFDRAAGEIAKATNREAIACEGQIDCIRLHLSGFRNSVASQGTAFTEEHAKMLKRVADSMVLAYDDDGAGHKATVKVARMMLALDVPVRVVSLPDGDDPDSFLRSKGAAAFRSLIDNAESVVSFQCRIERAKERDPGSIDAVARVTKAVLATIAECQSAVLRASMTAETAKLLNLPVSALAEELDKARHQAKGMKRSVVDEVSDDAESAESAESATADSTESSMPEVEDAAETVPPTALEFSLAAFLLANERNAEIDSFIGEFLPPFVCGSEFTRTLVDAWRSEVATGQEDVIANFVNSLSPRRRGWFDKILVDAGRSDASLQDPSDTLKKYVCGMWAAYFDKVRGELPAVGNAESDLKRVMLSAYKKRVTGAVWEDAKEIIRAHLTEK